MEVGEVGLGEVRGEAPQGAVSSLSSSKPMVGGVLELEVGRGDAGEGGDGDEGAHVVCVCVVSVVVCVWLWLWLCGGCVVVVWWFV